MKLCLYCGKELSSLKRYCNELCQYRFLSIKNDKPLKRSVAKDLRIARANAACTAGRLGVRYN